MMKFPNPLPFLHWENKFFKLLNNLLTKLLNHVYFWRLGLIAVFFFLHSLLFINPIILAAHQVFCFIITQLSKFSCSLSFEVCLWNLIPNHITFYLMLPPAIVYLLSEHINDL